MRPIVWKTEGPTDLLALISLGLPEGHTARSNLFGADEDPLGFAADGTSKEPMLHDLRGCIVYVVHDCDMGGQNGATKFITKNGRTRLGWAHAIAKYADEVRNVVLPYPIVERDGKDLRDWINDRLAVHYPLHAHESPEDKERLARAAVYRELVELAESMPVVPNPDPTGSMIVSDVADNFQEGEPSDAAEDSGLMLESIDDPHRLARLNLKLYRDGHGRDLKYWDSCWYRYKIGRYEKITEDYLRARVTQTIKQEFDRVWVEETKEYEAWKKSDRYDAERDKGAPTVRKVSVSLIRNVIEITKAECVLPSSVEMPCWLEDRSQPHLLAMRNGLLDLDRLESVALSLNAETDESEVHDELETSLLRDHSPNWFSTFCLDYDYVSDWDCPRWKESIRVSMEDDPERMAILQEWAGYLLTSTNDLQRFLCIEGEGGNGKTVYFAGIEAMLGCDNVSHIPIESFGRQFDLGTTIGKAANICGDVSELDQVAEGALKQFTGGDPMFFDRKGIEGISARPTAKLMCAWNNRPRFRDRSSGIWRRILLVPFNYTIKRHERVTGMDTRAYWVRSGEIPGILNWAIEGLFRLRSQGDFTESEICNQAMMDFRSESNPASEFLSDHIEKLKNGEYAKILLSHEIYETYEAWSRKFGIYPLASRQFFKELNKKFPGIAKKRSSAPGRPWGYVGIKFADEEIFGEKTPEANLFSEIDLEGA
jgi:P4 family phage/plasmid primase-like protien